MQPIALCILAIKMLIQHFFLKKIALLSLLSFLLSKTSFILSTLLALKQMFHSNHHEKSDRGSKLEIVHIPIKKKHPEFYDRDTIKQPSYIPLNSAQPEEYDDTQSSQDLLNQSEIYYANPNFDDNLTNNFLEP